MGQIAPRCRRVEPGRRARAYPAGLLCAVERKNGWQLAEHAGAPRPAGVQDFRARMRWDADPVADDPRRQVITHPSDADGVLVLDETGFVKQGTRSVGVQRPYSGTARRIGHALIERACLCPRSISARGLYLPEVWANDPVRRGAAGVPAHTVFAPQPQLGRQMLAPAFSAGVPCRWVTADRLHGG